MPLKMRWLSRLEGWLRAGCGQFLLADVAFCLYADVSALAATASISSAACWRKRVATTLDADVDPVHGKRFIRFRYAGAAADVTEAVERLAAWLKRQ